MLIRPRQFRTMNLLSVVSPLLVSCSLILISLTGLASSNTAEAALSVCEKAAQPGLLKKIKTIDPLKNSLKPYEKAMIQSVVLFTNSEAPLQSFNDALKVFADIRDDGQPGGLGGTIGYFYAGNTKIAFVTYYPGDNAYGQIFRIVEYGKNTRTILLGTITDSEVNCLNAVESSDYE